MTSRDGDDDEAPPPFSPFHPPPPPPPPSSPQTPDSDAERDRHPDLSELKKNPPLLRRTIAERPLRAALTWKQPGDAAPTLTDVPPQLLDGHR